LAIGIGAGLGLVCGPSAGSSERRVQFALAAAVRAVVIGLTLTLGGLLLGIPVAMPPVEDGERLAAPAYP